MLLPAARHTATAAADACVLVGDVWCADSVTAIFFIASLSEYDQFLAEDRTRNRMKESLDLFEGLINLRWFKSCPIILFLNKVMADRHPRHCCTRHSHTRYTNHSPFRPVYLVCMCCCGCVRSVRRDSARRCGRCDCGDAMRRGMAWQRHVVGW